MAKTKSYMVTLIILISYGFKLFICFIDIEKFPYACVRIKLKSLGRVLEIKTVLLLVLDTSFRC